MVLVYMLMIWKAHVSTSGHCLVTKSDDDCPGSSPFSYARKITPLILLSEVILSKEVMNLVFLM